MPVYQLVPFPGSGPNLGKGVRENISETDRFELSGGVGWFVFFPGTTVELSNKIGLTGQPPGEPSPIGSALVTGVSSYYGRGNSDMWEWLKIRFERAV